MKTQIRQATLEDVPIISDIFEVLETGKKMWSRNKLRNGIIDEKREYYLLIEKNNPVGAISLDFITGDCEVEAIAIRKKGRGYGSNLLNYSVQLAKDKKCEIIWCYTMDYYNARGFYESNNWKEVECEFDKIRGNKILKFAKKLI